MKSEPPASKLEILLEAARRATWDALKGPRHLKTGRFRPQPVLSGSDRETPESGGAAQPGVAADEHLGRSAPSVVRR